MYTWEIENFIKNKGFYLGGEDLEKIIASKESTQITQIRHFYNDGVATYRITVKDWFSDGSHEIEFHPIPYQDYMKKELELQNIMEEFNLNKQEELKNIDIENIIREYLKRNWNNLYIGQTKVIDIQESYVLLNRKTPMIGIVKNTNVEGYLTKFDRIYPSCLIIKEKYIAEKDLQQGIELGNECLLKLRKNGYLKQTPPIQYTK